MPPAWKSAARFLAVLLLLQWTGAVLPHSRAMARMASAHAVELCTHEGRKLVLVDENGKPLQPAPPTDCCTLCQAPLLSETPEPLRAARSVTLVGAAEPVAHPALSPFLPRGTPQQPRAPPRF